MHFVLKANVFFFYYRCIDTYTAPIFPQHHCHYCHPSVCMTLKNSARVLNCTSLLLRGGQGHLWMSLGVLYMSESQVDLDSNEDLAIMQAVTAESVTERCHRQSGMLIFSSAEWHWDGIIRVQGQPWGWYLTKQYREMVMIYLVAANIVFLSLTCMHLNLCLLLYKFQHLDWQTSQEQENFVQHG